MTKRVHIHTIGSSFPQLHVLIGFIISADYAETGLFIHDGVNLFAIYAPRFVIIRSERKSLEWVHKIKIKRAAVLEKRNMCCNRSLGSFNVCIKNDHKQCPVPARRFSLSPSSLDAFTLQLVTLVGPAKHRGFNKRY